MRNFQELKIWQMGMDLVDATYDVVELLPQTEKFGLASQMGRASVSVPSNIAEGSARKSDAHFVQYLETSLGSVFELQTQTMIVERRFKIPKEVTAKLLELLDQERKMLSRFISTLNSKNS